MSDPRALDLIWEPLAVGPMTVANRIVFAAHSPGYRDQQYIDYLVARARGGAGLIISGAAPIHPTADGGAMWRAYDPASIPAMERTIEAVHAEGTPLIVQLGHGGVHGVGAGSLQSWGILLAPSAVPSPHFGLVPKVMDQDDIEEIKDGFVRSAAHVLAAGADGVEVHAAHGLLLS